MAVRTAYVGTQVAGDVLTAANFSKLPGGWIGYVEVTASQTGITTVTDLTSLTLTVTVGTNRRIKVSGSGILNPPTVADGQTSGYINEGSTQLGYWATAFRANTGASDRQEGSVVLTPSSGSHTYKLRLERTTGTGTVGLFAAANAPAFLLVEDLGPAS